MRSWSNFLFFFLMSWNVEASLLTPAPTAPTQNNLHIKSGHAQFTLTGSYFTTASNFNLNEDTVSLLNNGAFNQNKFVGSLLLGASETINPFLNIAYVSTTAEMTGISRSNSGFGDMDLGLRAFLFPKLKTKLSLELATIIPLYFRSTAAQWSTFNSAPVLGPGYYELYAFGLGVHPISSSLEIGLGAGAGYRTLGYSNPIYYSAFVKYFERNSFFIRLGMLGQMTLQEDQFTSFPGSARAVDLNGGSFRYNTVNPQYHAAAIETGLEISRKFTATLGAQFDIFGKNYSKGTLAKLGITLNLGGESAPEEGPTLHKDQRFRQYYFEARVTEVTPKQDLFLIDKGKNDEVKVGEVFEVFLPTESGEGTGRPIARAKVIEAGPTRSKLSVLKIDTQIKEGFVCRKPLQ